MTRWQIRDAHFGLALVRAETEEEAVDIFYTWARKAQWRWAEHGRYYPIPDKSSYWAVECPPEKKAGFVG